MQSNTKDIYNEDYFIRGKEIGVSNYTNYSWRPELTMPFARRVADVLNIKPGQSVLDFGCSRGYLVKALRIMFIDAYGYDISEWAINNCDPEVKDHLFQKYLPDITFDYIVAKDVLEHLGAEELQYEVRGLINRLRNSMLIIVPLRGEGDTRYVREEDNQDKTHKLCWTLGMWLETLEEMIPNGFIVSGSWSCPSLKPAAMQHPKSCGFFFVRRL